MADNTLQLGSDTLRTVDRSSVKTGVTLLDFAASGEAELLGNGNSKPVVVASSGLTTATTAYSVGDVLGAEMTFTIGRLGTRGAIITSALLFDKAKLTGAVDLYLYDRASTPAADNAANSWSDANGAFCLGMISFETPTPSALNSIARGIAGLPVVVLGNASTDIKGVLVTRVAHTFFSAVSDLQVVLGIEQV